MFQNIGITEILLILVVVLLIFGPKSIPKIGKSIGEGLREFKKARSSSGEDEEDKKEQNKD